MSATGGAGDLPRAAVILEDSRYLDDVRVIGAVDGDERRIVHQHTHRTHDDSLIEVNTFEGGAVRVVAISPPIVSQQTGLAYRYSTHVELTAVGVAALALALRDLGLVP